MVKNVFPFVYIRLHFIRYTLDMPTVPILSLSTDLPFHLNLPPPGLDLRLHTSLFINIAHSHWNQDSAYRTLRVDT